MIYDLLSRWAESCPERVAIIGEDRTLNYGELFVEVKRVMAFLGSLGCRAGDRVIVAVPPSPEFHAVFFAGAALGLVTLPALPNGKVPDVAVRSEPRIAVGTATVLDSLRRSCPTLEHSIEWSQIPSHVPSLSAPAPSDEAPVLGVFSSGSSGEPSLYLRSQRTIVERARLRAVAHGFRSDDVMFTTRPYVSGSAINSHVIMPLYLGCTVVVQARFERFKAARAIADHRVTVLYAVPLIFELLASLPRNLELDFSALRLAISGSAALSASVAKQFNDRFGVSIRQRYSGSHFHPAFSFNADGPAESVGRDDGLFPLIVLDREGKPVTGEIGEVAFVIDAAPEQFRAVLTANPNRQGGLLYTGDLGRIDGSGSLYIVGRKSSFIKVGGNRVEPAEVEHVLRGHPRVKEAVVFGFKNDRADEAVAAVVAGDASLTYKELYEYCRERLAPYKCPARITFFKDLPRNEHGKIVRHLLEKPADSSVRSS